MTKLDGEHSPSAVQSVAASTATPKLSAAGSEGGPRKPTSRKADRAPRSHPYTYLRTWEGWLYLATVVDAHSRRVIGWAIDDHLRTDLAQDALKMAIILRGELPEEVIFHTDRGTQYTSAQITSFASKNAITRSMGHTGVYWDNAMAESFLATLKTEFHYSRVWPTRKHAKLDVGTWIEDRYNRRRRHASLGQITPMNFELQYSNQNADFQEAA